MYKKYTFLNAFLIGGLLAVTMAGCGRKDSAADAKDPKFEVTDSLLHKLLIDTVKEASALSEITLTGKITPDEDKMVKIFPLVSGVVRDVHVQLGDIVHKGQLLANMKSMEVAGFAKDAIASEADLKNTKRALQTNQDLYKSGLASQKDVEQAQGDYDKAVAEHKRTNAVMNINHSSADLSYEVKTPIEGYIVEKNVTNNMQVRTDNSQTLFTVADLSTVWAVINIYESDITSVQVGDQVRITTLSYPDKVFTGKIDKIYSMLDPDNKSIKARVKIQNPGNLLKPEMFANVAVKSVSGENLPVINTRALVFDNDRYYVLVVDGKAHVSIRPVEIAKKVEDRAYIKSGVKAGDRIIASRQVFMYESLKTN
jgi:cobalt-zinc-cadmium efflux system membrane fusion protein